jgi:hypothetical protein
MWGAPHGQMVEIGAKRQFCDPSTILLFKLVAQVVPQFERWARVHEPGRYVPETVNQNVKLATIGKWSLRPRPKTISGDPVSQRTR